MAKLNSYFDEYLKKIEPNDTAKKYAKEAHTRVREFLESDDQFSDHVIDTFLYGSYMRDTAIGTIKDVDIVVLTDFDTTTTPDEVLKKLKASLNRFYKSSDNTEYQTRSIKVIDPLPDKNSTLTLDVIPAILINSEDDPIYVPDRELKKWIKSHPKGHLSKTSKLNAENYSKQRYVPLVKIIKAWWKYQCKLKQPKNGNPKPKGFWLECLVSESFDPSKKYWADHFVEVLRRISYSYKLNSGIPQLNDPGLVGEKIRTGMAQEEFNSFLKTVQESLGVSINALREQDEHESSKMWQSIFGPDFSLAAKKEEYSIIERNTTSLIQLQDFSHKQELRDANITPLSNPHKINVHAEMYFGTAYSKENNRTYQGDIESKSEIPPHRWIKYIAEIPDEFFRHNVYWQVVNTGAHARKEGGLRGEIFPGGLVQWEQSLYTGMHWVECFIVDHQNQCVARSAPFYVVFRNPVFPYHILSK